MSTADKLNSDKTYFGKKDSDYKKDLDNLEKEFRKIKTLKKLDKECEDLTGDNYHSECSLLLAVHYGTKEEVDLVKELTMKQRNRMLPNMAYTKRIKVTSKFHAMHQEALETAKKK